MNHPKSRVRELVVQQLEKEVLIYDLNSNKAYHLNETSTLVWRMCDGETSVGQMQSYLADQLKAPVNAELIWLALDNFKSNDLLANSENIRIEFGSLSRREAIKKAGLASMIALPVVVGIIAPKAIQAASGCGAVASGTIVSARQISEQPARVLPMHSAAQIVMLRLVASVKAAAPSIERDNVSKMPRFRNFPLVPPLTTVTVSNKIVDCCFV